MKEEVFALKQVLGYIIYICIFFFSCLQRSGNPSVDIPPPPGLFGELTKLARRWVPLAFYPPANSAAPLNCSAKFQPNPSWGKMKPLLLTIKHFVQLLSDESPDFIIIHSICLNKDGQKQKLVPLCMCRVPSHSEPLPDATLFRCPFVRNNFRSAFSFCGICIQAVQSSVLPSQQSCEVGYVFHFFI